MAAGLKNHSFENLRAKQWLFLVMHRILDVRGTGKISRMVCCAVIFSQTVYSVFTVIITILLKIDQQTSEGNQASSLEELQSCRLNWLLSF